MMKRTVAAGLVLLLMISLFTACGNDLPAVYVQTVNEIMGYGPAGEYNICAGVVVAQNETKIERDESRKVSDLRVAVGQSVLAGEVLFTYDMEEIQLSIDKAKLEIEQMKNSVSDMATQITELEKEKAKAPQGDQLSYTVRIQMLETDKKEAEYNISVKERELQSLQTSAGSGAVTAPISGKVKAVNENGGYDDVTGQPLPFITLIEDGAYRVKGKVNELNRQDFYEGQTVVVRSRVDETMVWNGTISLIDTAPEESGNNNNIYYGVEDEMTSSSSYPFYIQLDTTEGLLLGQHVYIEPDMGQQTEETGLWLDASYVFGSETEGYFVWAANDKDEIEKRSVIVGLTDDMLYRYEIISGLTGEDRIAFPDERVQEGAPVTDTPVEEEVNPEDFVVDDNSGEGQEDYGVGEDFAEDFGFIEGDFDSVEPDGGMGLTPETTDTETAGGILTETEESSDAG